MGKSVYAEMLPERRNTSSEINLIATCKQVGVFAIIFSVVKAFNNFDGDDQIFFISSWYQVYILDLVIEIIVQLTI